MRGDFDEDEMIEDFFETALDSEARMAGDEEQLHELMSELVRDIRSPGSGKLSEGPSRLVNTRDREIAGNLIALIRRAAHPSKEGSE